MSNLEREVRKLLEYVDLHPRDERYAVVLVPADKFDGVRKALQEMARIEGPRVSFWTGQPMDDQC